MSEDRLNIFSLTEIAAMVLSLAGKIDAPARYLPTYGFSRDFAYPHIEVDHLYHWVVVERGSELQRRSTADLRELLYWIFGAITHQMASDFEVKNRKPDEDFRRQFFGKQVALLAQLDEEWARREEAHLEEILTRHPFRDDGPQGFHRVV